MLNVDRSARARRRRTVFACLEVMVSGFRFFPRIAAVGIALSLGAHSAYADEINWLGVNGDWSDTTRWDSGTVPTDADTVNFSGGDAWTSATYSVDTLNVSDGLVWVQSSGVFSAATINISGGGELRASADGNGVDPAGHRPCIHAAEHHERLARQ